MKSEIIKLLEESEFDSAIEKFYAWIAAEPNNWTPWVLLSGISVKISDFDLGMRAFKQMVLLRPESSIASSGYFECLFQLGHVEAAKSEMSRFAAHSDSSNTSKLVKLEQRNKIDSLA